jgi:hypothetical protein
MEADQASVLSVSDTFGPENGHDRSSWAIWVVGRLAYRRW